MTSKTTNKFSPEVRARAVSPHQVGARKDSVAEVGTVQVYVTEWCVSKLSPFKAPRIPSGAPLAKSLHKFIFGHADLPNIYR